MNIIERIRRFFFLFQWATLDHGYDGRKVRPILRFRNGEWKHRAWHVEKPTRLERSLEAVIRRNWRP